MPRTSEPLPANTRQSFDHGYRNREDVSTLQPTVMVKGSQNVLTNTFKRIGSRKGYTLDGQRSTPNSGQGIYGSFDWQTHLGTERNIRVGFNSTGTNGVVQYRYVAAVGDKYKTNTFTAGQVYWIDLYTSAGPSFNPCRFWDFNNELKDLMLWVDGTSNIFMWSGAVSKVVSTSWTTGWITTASLTAGGNNYNPGDILTVTGGTATVHVDTVAPGGVVTGVSLLSTGSGYTAGVKATTYGGIGAGCTVTIAVAQGAIKLTGAVGGLGFLSSGFYNQAIIVNGNAYTYSSIFNEYLLGISADPTGEPVSSVVTQEVQVFANGGGLPIAFKNSFIENLNNQVYVTASDNNSVYVSAVNSFQDFSFHSPRLIGEGAILTLDGVPTCLQQQSDSMFISAGKNYWYQTKFQISSDNTAESLVVVPIKTTANQACVNDNLATKIKNLIAFVSFETQINTIGITENFLSDPQVSDLSFPIVHDVQNIDFSGGCVIYFQKFLFVTAPNEGRMFIFNMTQDIADGTVDASSGHYWEAPQILPFGCLSIINGSLYGHGYAESNTFKLFDGLSDDGKPIKHLALFAYDSHGDRTSTKSSNEFFIEGYKSQATKLTAYLRRELNGPVASWSWRELLPPYIIPVVDDASIGKTSIGKSSIGGTVNDTDPLDTPPKFRLIQTYDRNPYFEEQIGFGSEGIGQWWEIVAFSTNASNTTENQSSIHDPPLAS